MAITTTPKKKLEMKKRKNEYFFFAFNFLKRFIINKQKKNKENKQEQ